MTFRLLWHHSASGQEEETAKDFIASPKMPRLRSGTHPFLRYMVRTAYEVPGHTRGAGEYGSCLAAAVQQQLVPVSGELESLEIS